MNTKIKTLLALTAATLTLPASASAGTYDVSACDLAGGAQNSWAPSSNHFQMTAYSICPSNGDWGRGIIARNGIASSTLVIGQYSGSSQRFTAPGGTGVTNVRFTGQLFRAAGQRWNVGLSNGSQMLFGIDGSTTWAFGVNLTDYNIPVPGNQSVYWEVLCVASSGCDAKSTGDAATHYVRAGAWIRSTVVTINDPTLPNAAWAGSLLSGTWVRGDQSFYWDSNDNSGISSASVTLGGRSIISHTSACNYTVPQPCPSSASGNTMVSTTGWPDGGHAMRIEVRDASGNVNAINGAAYIDNTAPARVTGPAVQGGENWRQSNSFKITWTNPGGQHAPITTRHYKLCPTDGGACTTGSQPGGQSEITLGVPRPGEWKAQVWLQDQAGNVSSNSASDPVTLRFDDTTPAAAKIDAPDGWIGNDQARALKTTLTIGAAPPPSGIAGYSVTTDGKDPDASIDTDSSWTVPDLTEGTPTLKARAISGSGKAGPVVSRGLRVDRTAPNLDASGLPDPGVWQDQPQTIKLTGTDEKSGLAAIQWQLDDGPAQTVPGDKTQLTITDDGRHTLTWETIDQAGNHSRTRQAVIRIDRSGPDTVQVNPTDPANPRLVTATVSDQGSGINSGLIELRPHGGAWRQLDTTLNDNGTQLTAQLDDLALQDGQYQLRTTATDNVGNSRSSSPAAITLPLRAASRVTITSAPGSRIVRGRVLGEDGKPLASASIAINQRSRIAKSWNSTRSIRTDNKGRFTYRVPTGPTRTIRFTYTGTDTIRPANADQSVRTPARTTIRVSRKHARLGQAIRFSGKLTRGPVPADGKVLALQAYDGGRWRNFPQVVTTGRDGRWTSTLRFERTKGTYTYRIRARVFRDGSYPYETGVSKTVRVTVHGR